MRSSWKYRDRAYRYILNDAGHVISNILLAARSLGFCVRIDYDFDDIPVNDFLGLDQAREVCLARIVLDPGRKVDSETEVSPLLWGMSLPMPEGDYGNGGDGVVSSTIRSIHEVNALGGAENKKIIQGVSGSVSIPEKDWHAIPARNKPPVARSFSESLVQRRSRRNFQTKPLEQDMFHSLMDLVMKGFALMEKTSRVHGAVKLGFLVHDVDGTGEGHYVADCIKHSIGCLDPGDKTAVMASACLDQRWLANASVHFVMTGDFERVENECGTRSYRYMMLNAGLLGQIIYLGATSLGIGCCGIGAFYDGEAAMVLDGDNDALLYLVAVGHVKGNG